MSKKVFYVAVAVIVLLIALGVLQRYRTPPGSGDGDVLTDLPGGSKWLDDSRQMFLAQSREYQGKTYILVTYGLQPTGGYSVEINDVIVESDKITVPVTFRRPKAGENVTDAISYPYDFKTVTVTGLPVEFVPGGDEEFVPGLLWIDELRPIVAQAAGIKVFEPAPGATVPRRFSVEGVANVFEGTVLYRLLGAGGNELAGGFTTAAMGAWAFFRIQLDVHESVPAGEKITLELFTKSAKDGSTQDIVAIDVTLNQ